MIVDIRTTIYAGMAPWLESMPITGMRIMCETLDRMARRGDPTITDPAYVTVTRNWESMADVSIGASTRTRIDAVSPVKEGQWIR